MQCERCFTHYELETDEDGNELEGCPNNCPSGCCDSDYWEPVCEHGRKQFCLICDKDNITDYGMRDCRRCGWYQDSGFHPNDDIRNQCEKQDITNFDPTDAFDGKLCPDHPNAEPGES